MLPNQRPDGLPCVTAPLPLEADRADSVRVVGAGFEATLRHVPLTVKSAATEPPQRIAGASPSLMPPAALERAHGPPVAVLWPSSHHDRQRIAGPTWAIGGTYAHRDRFFSG